MRTLTLLALLQPALVLAQGITVSPTSQSELEGLLKPLALEQTPNPWCTQDCATFLVVRVTGSLAQGTLSASFTGVVQGDKPAYVALLGGKPDLGWDSVTDARGARVPLYWTQSAYHAVLPPGSFSLRGTLTFGKNQPVTLRLLGPVGLVEFQVTDADVVGTGERRGVQNATYQITPKVVETGEAPATRLRLSLERSFTLARDKTFEVHVTARGAKPGQIISLPLLPGENIEDNSGARVGERRDGEGRTLDWVAQGADAELTYSGRWQLDDIALAAPTGAIKETWSVRCDDPFLCDFEGDAEAAPGTHARLFQPLPGQRLHVTWQELSPLEGIHTAAQEIALASKSVGKNLQQNMRIAWSSSSGSLVALRLPEGAMVSRFVLDDVATPVLRDKDGVVRVNLPSGTSHLEAAWEIAGASGAWIKPPTPEISAPVGMFYQRIYPADGSVALLAGGLAGSPRVDLWPSLAACLLLALLAAYLTRWWKLPLPAVGLWLGAALGFALTSPAALVPLLLALALGRWMGTTRNTRGRVRAFFELAVWAGLWLFALGLAFATLQSALFDGQPISVTSFVSGGRFAPANWGYEPLAWATYLAASPTLPVALPRPWALSVPVLLVRLVWTTWAIVFALFIAKEGRQTLIQLTHYWGQVRRAAKPVAPAR